MTARPAAWHSGVALGLHAGSPPGAARHRMKLHQLLFGGALLLCVVFISRVLLQQDQIGSTKRPSASSAGLERSIASLVQQQRRVETRLEALASGLAKLKLPPRSRPPQVEATQPALTEAGVAAEAAEVTAPVVQAEAAAEPADAECPERHPFHALLTAQSSYYQQWQARIMYFHWKKQAAAGGPCTDMTGFTRLVASEGGKPDGLEAEMPSVFVKQMTPEELAKHGHFGVLNRPHSVQQMIDTGALPP